MYRDWDEYIQFLEDWETSSVLCQQLGLSQGGGRRGKYDYSLTVLQGRDYANQVSACQLETAGQS
jgi:hypothetical protein